MHAVLKRTCTHRHTGPLGADHWVLARAISAGVDVVASQWATAGCEKQDRGSERGGTEASLGKGGATGSQAKPAAEPQKHEEQRIL
jgi:hypothetical protein